MLACGKSTVNVCRIPISRANRFRIVYIFRGDNKSLLKHSDADRVLFPLRHSPFALKRSVSYNSALDPFDLWPLASINLYYPSWNRRAFMLMMVVIAEKF